TLLTKGVHYVLAYADNINAGTATVTVTGKGIYTGTQAKTFTINKATAAITWVASAPIITGMKLSDAQLNAFADIPGAFAYDPPAGTVLLEGEHALTVTFTPEDTVNWATTTAEVELSVVAGTVMWLTADFGNDEAAITLAFGETETAALAEDAFDVAANPGQRASLCSASGDRHLSHDFRPFPGENRVTRWRLAIAESDRRGGAAQPQHNRGEDNSVTLNWNISAAAQDRQLYLLQIIDEQPVGHAIDMRVTASVAVSSGSVYEIAYAPITEASVNVAQGWNFIGCPVMATESDLEQLERFISTADGQEVLWHWKSGRYKIWPEDEPLRPETGYFFYSHTAGRTIPTKGIKADGVMLLQPGWNFISLPDDCQMPAVEGIVSQAWRLHGNAYQFVVSGEALAAGSNYWIFVNSGKPVLVNFGN
ncbi:MAG TPA: hypothetical protein PKY10_15650, partial [Lentisphaeria bacterium]|nr:hypothetical protein [Lentisphaeria bacterium]